MANYAFLYCCPITGQKIQGVVPSAPNDNRTYETVTCAVCSRVHLVNPTTGHVAGALAQKW